MKRAILLSVLQIAGTPLTLVATGHTPQRYVKLLGNSQTSSEGLQALGVLAIWLVWVWGVVSAIAALKAAQRMGVVSPSRMIPTHIAMSAAALVGALDWGTNSEDEGSIEVVESQSQVVGESRQVDVNLPRTAMTILAGFLLRQVQLNIHKMLESARSGTHYRPHTRMSQLILQSLMYKSRHVPKLSERVYWPDSSSRLVNEQELDEIDRIPIGIDGLELVSLGLSQQTTIRIHGAQGAASFVEYLTAIARLVTVVSGHVTTTFNECGHVEVQIHLGTNGESLSSINASFDIYLQGNDDWIEVRPPGLLINSIPSDRVEKTQLSTLTHEMGSRLTSGEELGNPVVCATDCDLVVQLMGPVEVTKSDGTELKFRKSKSEELLTWLVLHRDRPLRDVARTALWDHSVEDSTFNNVVSELRRAIRAAHPSIDFEIAHNRKKILIPIGIRTDVELLEEARWNVRRDDSVENWRALHEAVSRVRGLPFEGANYDWADAEGLTSHIVLKIMNACTDLARYYLAISDAEGVYFATSQGLRALPGNQEMLELRAQVMNTTTKVNS
jgi:hypothetical protein